LIEVPSLRLGDGLFNLGGNWSTKVLDAAERIASLAEKVLGSKPKLYRCSNSREPTPASLNYDTSKLRASGFSVDSQAYIDSEILQLLNFCKLHLSNLQ
jgi:hypothetical protein